jgi:hypothetical protein
MFKAAADVGACGRLYCAGHRELGKRHNERQFDEDLAELKRLINEIKKQN